MCCGDMGEEYGVREDLGWENERGVGTWVRVGNVGEGQDH